MTVTPSTSKEKHYSPPDSLINNSAIKACVCLLPCSHAAPKDASHAPLSPHGVNVCGRYQLKQISKQNKVQSTFWLRKTAVAGQPGITRLLPTINSLACPRETGGRKRERGKVGWMEGGGGGGGRRGAVEFQCADGAEHPAEPMMLFVLSADRRGADNQPQATAN